MAEDLKLEDLDLSKAASLSSSELESLGLNKKDIFSAQQKATFMADKTLGIGQGAITSKQVDNKTIDSYINEIEKPTGSDVYSKQAAMYRAQGEGQVLRTQKNLSNLFGPTINLLKEREAASIARYTILKERMPEFDDSVIFGEGGVDKTPMPIADEIKSISSSVKEDLRMLSRLNPNDERYDEIRKRVEKNQENIVKFDEINNKLLQIRNEGTDQSQWSTGMTDTERNMWLDIYSSNGKNIKIQDGKLVWTDEKGTTRNTYNIPDDNTVEGKGVYDDETYRILLNTRGGDTNSKQYKKGEALSTLHWFGDQDLEGNDPGSHYSEKSAKEVQESLNTLGITDNDGNALEVDGKFGPKTREAFNKYLKVRGELNEEHLDQYMTEEDAAKYRTSKTTGVGETKVIDLEFIKSGPTMISNEATVMDMTMRGNAQAFINSGGEVGSESYIRLIQQPLFEMNKLPNEDMKSLIFDGLNTDDKDLFTGMNTNDFLEGVIRNHYGNDLSQEEIQEKIELIRSGDVTQQYKDGKGGTSTLKTQFMNWYKGKIDEKIEEGKKDPLIGGASGAGSGTGGGTGTGTGTGTGGAAILNSQLGSTLQENAVVYDWGSRGVQPYTIENSLNGVSLETGEIGISGENLKLIIDNDAKDVRKKKYEKSGFIKSESTYKDQTYKLGTDNILYSWDYVYDRENDSYSDEKAWVKSDFNADSNDPAKVAAYQRIIEAFDSGTMGAMGTVSSDIAQFDMYDKKYKAIHGKGKWESKNTGEFYLKKNTLMKNNGEPDWEAIRKKGTMRDNYVLDYDNNEDLINGLTKGYGQFGFYFKMEGDDDLYVYFKDTDGTTIKLNDLYKKGTPIITDRYTESKREFEEENLIVMMRAAWDNSKRKQEHFSNVRLENNNGEIMPVN